MHFSLNVNDYWHLQTNGKIFVFLLEELNTDKSVRQTIYISV